MRELPRKGRLRFPAVYPLAYFLRLLRSQLGFTLATFWRKNRSALLTDAWSVCGTFFCKSVQVRVEQSLVAMLQAIDS
jgi:hypothetical protein